MTKEPTNSFQSSSQLELLSLVIDSSEEIYPWDTTTLAAEAYFSEVEQSNAGNWLEQELTAAAPNFLSQLDRQWQATTSSAPSLTQMQAKLHEQFLGRVPQTWLDTISRQASQVIHTQKTLSAQLVQCVRELVPNCLEEDLLVLARPYAYAMRSELVNAPMQLEITAEQWVDLSEIQQAKLSFAIARYAIEQIKAGENI